MADYVTARRDLDTTRMRKRKKGKKKRKERIVVKVYRGHAR